MPVKLKGEDIQPKVERLVRMDLGVYELKQGLKTVGELRVTPAGIRISEFFEELPYMKERGTSAVLKDGKVGFSLDLRTLRVKEIHTPNAVHTAHLDKMRHVQVDDVLIKDGERFICPFDFELGEIEKNVRKTLEKELVKEDLKLIRDMAEVMRTIKPLV